MDNDDPAPTPAAPLLIGAPMDVEPTAGQLGLTGDDIDENPQMIPAEDMEVEAGDDGDDTPPGETLPDDPPDHGDDE